MYKAKISIGGYKIGEEVPAEQAELWMTMYKTSPIEKTEGSSKPEPTENKNDNNSGNDILEDYLDRNQNVVKKNVSKDNLTKDQLNKLLEIESSNKKRDTVISSIKKKLKTFN